MYDRAYQLEPNNVDSVKEFAYTYLKLKRYDDGLHMCQRALEIAPQAAEPWSIRSRIYEAQKLYNDAVAAARRAIEQREAAGQYPSRVYLNQLGYTLFLCKRYAEARDAFERMRSAYPENALAYANIGAMLTNLRRYQEALVAIERGLALSAQSRDISEYLYGRFWTNRGRVCYFLGRYDEALANFKQALEGNPKEQRGWLYQGRTLTALGRYDQALASLNTATALDPEEAEGWVAVSELVMQLGDTDRALTTVDHALTLDAELVWAWRQKAAILRALGRETEASEADSRADALDAIQQRDTTANA